jgi:hypothetical protein
LRDDGHAAVRERRPTMKKGVRIVLWNMDAWKGAQHRADHGELAWRHLLALRPDVALLQEAPRPDPAWLGDSPSPTVLPAPDDEPRWCFGRANARWTTALAVFGGSASEIPTVPVGARDRTKSLVRSHMGAFIAARVQLAAMELFAISLYGQLEGPLLNGETYATTSVHRSLSDLAPLLDRERARGRLVLGGDLNCSTQLAPPWREAHRAVFARFRAFGLANVFESAFAGRGKLGGCPCQDEFCCHHGGARKGPRCRGRCVGVNAKVRRATGAILRGSGLPAMPVDGNFAREFAGCSRYVRRHAAATCRRTSMHGARSPGATTTRSPPRRWGAA